MKIGVLKYIQGHKYLKAIYFPVVFCTWKFRKKILESRGHRVFLILKSYIHKLSKSTMGCHVPDANLKATLNLPDPAHSIWINFGVLCSNSQGWYQWNYSKLPISHVAIKKCVFQSSGSRLHKGQQCKKLNRVENGYHIHKDPQKFTAVSWHIQKFTLKNLYYQGHNYQNWRLNHGLR